MNAISDMVKRNVEWHEKCSRLGHVNAVKSELVTTNKGENKMETINIEKLVAEQKAEKMSMFDDCDFRKRTELEAAQEEIDALRDQVDYLIKAQNYTAEVGRQLMLREIEALSALSGHDITTPELIKLVSDYNAK